MANLRELRSRIKSVNSTKKITKAREMIATSKITKAQARVAEARPFADQITAALEDLASSSSLDHPMLAESDNPTRAAVLVVTSDGGMCGGYNRNALKEASELVANLEGRGLEVDLYVMGRAGTSYYDFREIEYKAAWTGDSEHPVYQTYRSAFHLLADLVTAGSDGTVDADTYVEGTGTVQGVDEVHLVYTRFDSMLTQTPVARRLSPVEMKVDYEDGGLEGMHSTTPDAEVQPEVTFEPDADTLLNIMLPRYLSSRVFAALLESSASESAARRTAMKAATDNATELVNDLSREANQARQAQITQEISEIVGGAGALAASAGSD